MEIEKGKLLITTKEAQTGRMITLGISSAVVVCIGIFCLSVPEAFKSLSRDNYQIISFLLGFGMIAYAAFMCVFVWLGKKSYVAAYENRVVGTTALSLADAKTPMQNFELRYEEIVNVSESGKTITIYTAYEKYNVLALKNREEIMRAIRQRMSGNQNSHA